MRDVKTMDPSREDCERVIVDMLLEGVLREDFHFTPYSTISYLLPGPKAGLMHSGKRLYMHLKANLFGWRGLHVMTSASMMMTSVSLM